MFTYLPTRKVAGNASERVVKCFSYGFLPNAKVGISSPVYPAIFDCALSNPVASNNCPTGIINPVCVMMASIAVVKRKGAIPVRRITPVQGVAEHGVLLYIERWRQINQFSLYAIRKTELLIYAPTFRNDWSEKGWPVFRIRLGAKK